MCHPPAVGTLLGTLAAGLVFGAWIAWWRRLQAVDIGDRTPFVATEAAGVLLALAAFSAGAGVVGGLAAVLALLGGGVFLGLFAVSAQERRIPAVRVGEPVPAFSAPDAEGRVFDSASLAGRPYLLKFFRGHW